MKKATKEVLKEAANNLMLELTESEYDILLDEFNTMFKHMEYISEIDGIDDVEPMSFPFDITNDFLREDVPSSPVDRDTLLKNTKDVENGQVRLPKVVN